MVVYLPSPLAPFGAVLCSFYFISVFFISHGGMRSQLFCRERWTESWTLLLEILELSFLLLLSHSPVNSSSGKESKKNKFKLSFSAGIN